MIMEDLGKHLANNQSILSVIEENTYIKSINDIVKSLDQYKICYITLNINSHKLISNFKKNNINTKNIFFIDAASGSKQTKASNVVTVTSPSSLTEIETTLISALNRNSFDVVLFDSLSTLNIYNKPASGVKFAADIINKTQLKNTKILFTCLKGDLQSDLIRETSQLIDEVLDMKEIYYDKEKIKSRMSVFYAISVVFLGFFPILFSKSSITGFAVKEGTTFSISNTITLPIIYFLILTLSILVLAILLISAHWKNIIKR